MKRLLTVLLFLLVPFVSLALDSSLVRETSWDVGVYNQNGAKAPPSDVWHFHSDKTVNGADWNGVWQEAGGDRIKVVIMRQNSLVDQFDVDFINPGEFIAFKDGQRYRWGNAK
jgi:hypothetical protein